MNLCVSISTKGRHNCFLVGEKLLRNFPPEYPIYLVIEKEDEKNYREKYPNYNYIILPESGRGIGYSRTYAYWYLSQRHDYVVTFDDDIAILFVADTKEHKLKRCKEPEDYKIWFDLVKIGFQKFDIVSFPMNVVAGLNIHQEKFKILEDGHMGHCVLAFNLKVLREEKFWGDPGFKYLEDRFIQMYYFVRGYRVGMFWMIAYAGFDQKEGGLVENGVVWRVGEEGKKRHFEWLTKIKETFPSYAECITWDLEAKDVPTWRWSKMRKVRDKLVPQKIYA